MTIHRTNVLVSAIAPLLLASAASAATQYFDANGATAGYGITSGGTYSWDDANWATATGGAAATSNYSQDSYTLLSNVTTPYTITVSSTETVGALSQNGTASTVTIAQAPATSGSLLISLTSNASVPLQTMPSAPTGTAASLQPFRPGAAAANLIITAPISGPGGIVLRNAGTLSLYGNNSFAGGFEGTGSETVNFNNNNSFGTGSIVFNGDADNFTNTSGTAVTLPNFIQFNGSVGINFNEGGTRANPGLILNGGAATTYYVTGVATGSNPTMNLGSTNFVKMTSAISGIGTLTVSGTGGGLILAAPETSTGTTRVVGTSLYLDVANAFASNGTLTLSSGTLNPGGFNQASTATALSLVGSGSTIDFTTGAAEADFANSSAVAWTGTATLTLLGFDPAIDKVRFGTSTAGLTNTQLSQFKLSSDPNAVFTLSSTGFLQVPEPASLALGSLAMALLGGRWRKNKR